MFRRRAQLARIFDQQSTGQLSKILAAEWDTLDQDEKSYWALLYQTYIEAFNKKFQQYKFVRGPNGRERADRTERKGETRRKPYDRQ